MKTHHFLLFIIFVTFFFHLSASKRPKWNDLKNYTFEQYLSDFNKVYQGEEILLRKEIFELKLENILRHNEDNSRSWKKGVNHMTDWTKDEFTKLLGYRKKKRRTH